MINDIGILCIGHFCCVTIMLSLQFHYIHAHAHFCFLNAVILYNEDILLLLEN